MNRYRIAHATVDTWAGRGGRHWYAFAFGPDGEHTRASRTITAAEARALNREDRGAGYREGDRSERFETAAGARDAIVKAVRAALPGVDLIVKGSPGSLDPRPVLWASDRLAHVEQELRYISEVVEALYGETRDPWARYPERMGALCGRWDELIGRTPR